MFLKSIIQRGSVGSQNLAPKVVERGVALKVGEKAASQSFPIKLYARSRELEFRNGFKCIHLHLHLSKLSGKNTELNSKQIEVGE